ncbi:MAG TPA: L-aspartate oxidase [Ignavibacteria bacterium]
METDYLIIGSGIAGLSLAVKLSSLGNVLVITKKQKSESNTNYAQGGIAAVISGEDNFALHFSDTIECGAGLCDDDAVNIIVRQGPERIRELIKFGTKFSEEKGSLKLGKEGGHSRHRIVHSNDLTGKEIERALLQTALNNPKIKILEYYFGIDFLTKKNLIENNTTQSIEKLKNCICSDNECYGIYALNVGTGKVEKIISKYTILASGGLGQVYLHTTNPAIATGDGVAMSYRSGCEIANMEFVQFHPTTLFNSMDDVTSQVFLISEAVRGAGAVLKSLEKEDFMQKYDYRKSLAPRDIVARAIDNEMKKSGDPFVYLDVSSIGVERFKKEFPHIYENCLKHGIDIEKDMIPVVPAAHYACGGVKTDLSGRTCLDNLYACGEVAMTGVHGANRLASNSLLEAVAFSENIYEDLVNISKNNGERNHFIKESDILDWNEEGTENNEEWILISHNKKEIKEVMSDYIGIVRNTYRLQRAYRRIKMMKDEIEEFYKKTKVTVELLELRNLVTVAYLIIRSAMKRKESRGLHYMLDFPDKNDKKYKHDTVIFKKNIF